MILFVIVRCASSVSIMVFAVHEVKIVVVFSQAMLLLSMWFLPQVKTVIAPSFPFILFLGSLVLEKDWENKRCIISSTVTVSEKPHSINKTSGVLGKLVCELVVTAELHYNT